MAETGAPVRNSAHYKSAHHRLWRLNTVQLPRRRCAGASGWSTVLILVGCGPRCPGTGTTPYLRLAGPVNATMTRVCDIAKAKNCDSCRGGDTLNSIEI